MVGESGSVLLVRFLQVVGGQRGSKRPSVPRLSFAGKDEPLSPKSGKGTYHSSPAPHIS